jgi:hypothetical protein
MKASDLLETYPKAAKVINEFYRSKMLESLKTENIPEEFKEMLKTQEFDNEYVATFIDKTPRILFDVFDANDVYIQINVFNFSYSINQGSVIAGSWKTRIEAEKAAVEQAFQILNDKL